MSSSICAGLAGRLAPGLIDIDMAGGAGAGAAAFGGDAGDRVLHRRLHHRHARLGFDDVLGSVVQNIRDPGHGIGATCFSSLWEASGGRRPRALKAAGANGIIPATWRRLYRPIETETPGSSARDALAETSSSVGLILELRRAAISGSEASKISPLQSVCGTAFQSSRRWLSAYSAKLALSGHFWRPVLLSRFCNHRLASPVQDRSRRQEFVNNKNDLSRVKHNCGLRFF